MSEGTRLDPWPITALASKTAVCNKVQSDDAVLSLAVEEEESTATRALETASMSRVKEAGSANLMDGGDGEKGFSAYTNV